MKEENMQNNSSLLSVRDLTVGFRTDGKIARAVDGVSFDLQRGETIGIVGESGCGKTMTALSILRLTPPSSQIISGEIVFDGNNLLSLSENEMRAIRGNKISMIFQEPMTSLDPVFSIGSQIAETIRAHYSVKRSKAKEKVIELLDLVGIPEPKFRSSVYPHELSGGMQQRIVIAMALACNPSVLIADEPTTALDVTVQAQILKLLSQLQKKFGMSVLIIAHDLGVIAQVADRIAMMYASKIVEFGTADDIFFRARHPYTVGLLQSIPLLSKNKKRLNTIPGSVPDPIDYPPGCHFSTRCDHAVAKCHQEEPPLESVSADHTVACWEKDKINFSITNLI